MGKMGERGAASDAPPKATLAYGEGPRKSPPALADTVAAVHDTLPAAAAAAHDTLPATASVATTAPAALAGNVRSTVLPRIEGG
ncbi:MAG TPA: hypothetical protein VIA18_21735, partial [Polyangia bacterium]|nr:hypothetical protein [Polyangia bacterium]